MVRVDMMSKSESLIWSMILTKVDMDTYSANFKQPLIQQVDRSSY
jgi:hypothetical protein